MSGSALGITLRNIHKTFAPDVTVLDGLDLKIEAGKFTALIGPSGCGKTTILCMIGAPNTTLMRINAISEMIVQ